MTSPSGEVTSARQVRALPVGQWVVAADRTVACLFDTDQGTPARMWGLKPDHGRVITSFVALDGLVLPLKLGDGGENDAWVCLHRTANECGQCLRCGQPGIADRHPVRFDTTSDDTPPAAAAQNRKVA